MHLSFPDPSCNITPPADIDFGEVIFRAENVPSHNEPFAVDCVITTRDTGGYDVQVADHSPSTQVADHTSNSEVADQSHKSEASYAWQSMPNHNENTFDDSMRCNLQAAAKADYEMEQASQSYKSAPFHEAQQKIEPASSEPLVPLDATISAVERKIESNQGNRALMQRLHQINYERSGFHVFSNSKLDKEFVFINMTLDGTTTKLLNDIQYGDLKTADYAFGSLNQAWPYRHAAGYIAPREISGAENRLMGLLGGDLMKKAELCLVSRPDYLQAHGDRIYREVMDYQKECKAFANQGNIENLKTAEQGLKQSLETKNGRLDIAIKARYIVVQKILSDPIMKSYAVITNGSLQQAKQEVRYIEQQIYNHFAKQGITDPFEVNAMIPESPYHETLIAAHHLFEARPDLQAELQANEVKHLYHTTDLTQAISENTDMLELYKAYDFGNNARLESRIEKLNQILEGEIVLSHETYVISDNATGLLTREGLDPQLYLECAGNQLQQHIHQECIGIVEELALANQDALVSQYCHSMLQFVDVAREYNQANSPIEAVKFVDVCWSIVDCCKAAGEGIIEGAIGTVINHPIETALLCVGGPQYLLAYHIGKIIYVYADIKIASLMSEEAGGQKLAEYLQPLTDCIDAIHTGDITLRGSIKVGATVATQFVLQGKVNAGLKEFLKTTKEQAKKHLKKNPTATVAQYALTPDGRLLRAVGGPGKNTTLLKRGGNGPKNSSSKNQSVSNAKKQASNVNQNSEKIITPDKSIPAFIAEKRMPLDHETILSNDRLFNPTKMRVKGARVYEKDGMYYHRDTQHFGASAHLEVYNSNRKHIGIADVLTGILKPNTAVKGRKIK
jgi:hypothetical protein